MVKWLSQAVSAVKYLHENDVLHRDIKPMYTNYLINIKHACFILYAYKAHYFN